LGFERLVSIQSYGPQILESECVGQRYVTTAELPQKSSGNIRKKIRRQRFWARGGRAAG
jgi:hypothetical protein